MTKATNAFARCTSLGWTDSSASYAFPNDLFEDCRNTLQNVSAMFGNCYNLNGYLHQKEGEKGLFENCFNLTNVGYFFANCHCLKGNVPDNMFKSSIIDEETGQA